MVTIICVHKYYSLSTILLYLTTDDTKRFTCNKTSEIKYEGDTRVERLRYTFRGKVGMYRLREGRSFKAVIRMNGRGNVEEYKQWESVEVMEVERYIFR